MPSISTEGIRSPREVDWTDSWPVVIVGGGGCGLTAALSAARLGERVLLLEKQARPAGNTALSTGLIPAAGTRFQREADVTDDSPDLMARDILAKNGGEGDSKLTRVLCDSSASLVEWLADVARCEIVCYTDFLYPGQSRFRMHGPPEGYGASLISALYTAIRREPNIELRANEPVRGLVWDGERVLGVHTDSGAIRARSIVLALNGFAANQSMVEKYLGPEVVAAIYFGAPGNTGEGILWCLSLDVATECMDAYQGHGSVAYPDGPLVTWGVVTNGAVLVNHRGQRFGDESSGYSEYARNVISQPGGEAWEIFDEKIHAACRGTRYEEVIAAEKVIRASTIEHLSEETGLPVRTLSSTLEQVNQVALGKAHDPFGRTDFGLAPLEPPFYAVRVQGALFHTQGGLKVDARARVLSPNGTAIHGLYAGGGTAAGISGHGAAGYLAGNGLLTAFGLGRIAGESAVDDLGTESYGSTGT